MGILRLTPLLPALLVFAAALSYGGEVIRDLAEINRIVAQNGDGSNVFETVATVSTPVARSNGDFTIENETGATQIKERAFWPDKVADIVPGDRVRIRGDIIRGQNGILYTYARHIDVLSHGPAPLPVEASAADFYHGKYIYRLIRITGTVVDAFTDEIDPRFMFLIISCGRESVYVSIRKPQANARQLLDLVDSKVSVVGIGVRERSSRPQNRKGLQLCASGPSAITIVTPPPADRFNVPTCTNVNADILEIMTGDIQRRKITGQVIAVWHGNRVLVRTPYGISRIDILGDGALPSCGSTIEAVGTPETDLYNVNLSSAIWRPTQLTVPPGPSLQQIKFDKLVSDERGRREIKPEFHGCPVTLRGTVRELREAHETGTCLTLECGKHLVPVEFNSPDLLPADLGVGCAAAITGVCIMDVENWRPQSPFPHIEGFILAVRAPQDVTILSRPPWWTAGRLIAAIAILAGTLLAILLWNLSLQRLVERRSRELAQEKVGRLESELKIQERTRLAVELHDSVAQNLTGVSMEIDTATQLAQEKCDSMFMHLAIAAKTLQSCRDELRNCLWDLRSRALEENNMNEAIRRTVAPQITGVELVIRFSVPRKRLSDDTTHALLRIIRELVVNATRHGKAKTIRIAGGLEENRVLFSVRDDGIGFNPDTCPGVLQGHFGLQGIKERVSKFGGNLSIESAPGAGTKVTVGIAL